MVKPWLEAGYECYIVDIQHPPAYDNDGITDCGNGLYKVHADLTRTWLPPFDVRRVAIVFSFPPCDHLAVSGARWFQGKGLRLLSRSIDMFATASEFCEFAGVPYFLENPVSTISSHWRKPDTSFHPYFFTGYNIEDNYTKKTCLWIGNGFVMPEEKRAEELGDPDDRIHKCPPSKDRANIRSKTPAGFARAVFEANHKNIEAVA